MTTQSQETRILDYLLKGYSLTPLDGFRKFGTMNLAQRIFRIGKKLKNPNVYIGKTMVNRGEKRVARYRLVDNSQI